MGGRCWRADAVMDWHFEKLAAAGTCVYAALICRDLSVDAPGLFAWAFRIGIVLWGAMAIYIAMEATP